MEYEIDEEMQREWNREYRDVVCLMTEEARAIIVRQMDLAFQRGVETGKARLATAVWSLA